VDPLVIGLVVGSAVLHVAWNVRLKTAGDPLRIAAIGITAASLIVVPVAIAGWWLDGARTIASGGVALGIASGVVETAYFVLLAAAYRRGDLSVVYPIARGTAPLLLVATGVVVFGEELAVTGWAGVALLLAGFLLLQRPWLALANRGAGDRAVLFAVATGVTIAVYTAIDRAGTRLVPPLQYAAILWPTAAVLLLGWLRVVDRRPIRTAEPGQLRTAAIVGVLTLGAYLLVLIALSVAPLTAVAPLRESASVVAAAWGAIRLREAAGGTDAARRIGASALIVVGAILLALPGPAAGG
jgi:drug/metabolite transporter (DMT)-like permease